ncbi:MAG: carbohydrate-binding protein [Planctomycetota bacterium]
METLEPRTLFSADFIAPWDSGVLNVTDYGAIPNDGIDDTAAIQAALDEATLSQDGAFIDGRQRKATGRIVYLPDGVYDVSDTLTFIGNQRRVIVQGESRDGTVIRLSDNNPDYATPDVSQPKAVLSTGNQPGQGFRNAIRDLTVDVGSGNAGAVGIEFNANNQGSIRDVKIASSDANGAGLYGLDLSVNAQVGPFYIEDLEVVGFDYGVYDGDRPGTIGAGSRSITADGLVLKDQHLAGLRNENQLWNIRDFYSKNTGPAIENTGNLSVLNLIDATLVGDGSTDAAIDVSSVAYLRDVTATGYAWTADNRGTGPAADLAAGMLDGEWTTFDAVSQFASPEVSLNLDVFDEPDIAFENDLNKWANPLDYGAAGDGVTDDTAAIQAALDDPTKTTLYFPGGKIFRIDGTLHVRGTIERIIGYEGVFLAGPDTGASIRFEDGEADAVIFERFIDISERVSPSADSIQLIHAADRAVVFSSLSGFDVAPSVGGGDYFLTDVVDDEVTFLNPDQDVYARQLNVENATGIGIDNRGADFWLFGFKTEGQGTKVRTADGGRTELIGAHILTSNDVPIDDPLFVIDEADASYVGVRNLRNAVGDERYVDLVEETRDGVTRTLTRTTNPGRSFIPIYTGYEARNAFDAIEGEAFDHHSGMVGVFGDGRGAYLGNTSDGAWTRYDQIDFGSGALSVEVSAASRFISGSLELYLDAPSGTPIATVDVPVTGGWENYELFSVPVTAVSGVHDLYLKFVGDRPNKKLIDVDYLKFNADAPVLAGSETNAYRRIEAEDYAASTGGVGVYQGVTSDKLGQTTDGGTATYENVDFGAGAVAIEVSASSFLNPGSVEVYLDGARDTPIAVVDVPTTGGWGSFQTFSAPLASVVTGQHDVTLRFVSDRSARGKLMDIDRLRFITQAETIDGQARIQAEDYAEASGVFVNNGGTGQRVSSINNGDWLRFDGVNFGPDGVTGFSVSAASGSFGGTLEIRLGSLSATPIVTLAIGRTGGWNTFQSYYASLEPLVGIHDVFITGSSPRSGGLFNLDFLEFTV